jgi:hypothetical protein
MDPTNPQELPAVVLTTSTPAVPPEVLEQVLIGGDLSGLTSQQRADYYGAVCRALGLNPFTKPFEYLTLNGKLRLYALRDCADQLRRLHGISIYITNRERLSDLYVVTARAKDRTGREDESTGAVPLGNLKGDALANALMKAETKAKRRVTLSLAGLGWLDEIELATIPGVQVGEPSGQASGGKGTLITPQGGDRGTAIAPTDGQGPQIAPAAVGGSLRPVEGENGRLSQNQARELKQLAQHAYGFREGERRLRADLGFEMDESLTLRHLAAHVTAEQYARLRATYAAQLRQQVEADVP